VTFDEDESDALLRAIDALETVLAARIDDREDIPLPSPAAGRPCVVLPALTTAKVLLYRAMREAGLRKADLVRRLGWHAPQIDRLLDLNHASRLDQIEAALGSWARDWPSTLPMRPSRDIGARPRKGLPDDPS
jgi:antitoxin HicB